MNEDGGEIGCEIVLGKEEKGKHSDINSTELI